MDSQKVKKRKLTSEDVDKIMYAIENGVDITFGMVRHLDLKEKGIKSLFRLLESNEYELKNGDWVKKRNVDTNAAS